MRTLNLCPLMAGILAIAQVNAETPPRWVPSIQSTWQYQLTGTVDQTVNATVYNIDLFDNPKSVVDALHLKGYKVVCYMSAGSYEDWRPDATRFPSNILGRTNGWPGERWLDIRNWRVLGPIMEARMDLCKEKGFDAVEADNVDGYSNRTGFPLTANDQLTYNRNLAIAAHARGLSIALKNDVDQVADLVNDFDFTINEQCFEYKECDALMPFIHAGKAVLNVEYRVKTNQFCSQANSMHFSSIRKKTSLNAWREKC